MASDQEKGVWETKLVDAGYVVSGIDLSNAKFVAEVWKVLEIGENHFSAQSRVRAFIQEQQWQARPEQKKQAFQPKRPKLVNRLTQYDAGQFCSPLATELPKVNERGRVWDFLAPANWLEDLCKKVLEQARLEDSDNPRVSPLALIRCSRGGKTRSMIELAQKVREADKEYGIIFVTFNTATPLHKPMRDPLSELCIRIAFAALKERDPDSQGSKLNEFNKFYSTNEVGREWVENWLSDRSKCILFVDELNLLQDHIDDEVADFLKQNFLLPAGRGLVFSSHVASMKHRLTEFMSPPSNREVLLRPLPIIPSLQKSRDKFEFQDLSAQEALFLGLLPGLICEKKNNHPVRERRTCVVHSYIECLLGMTPEIANNEVRMLLKSLLTGKLHRNTLLQELMTADLKQSGDEMILRWIPYHMTHVLLELSQQGAMFLPRWMCSCLSNIVELFGKFHTSKWESGDAWEVLFLVVLLVRCLTGSFDDVIVPLGITIGNTDTIVNYNQPYNASSALEQDFFTSDPLVFIRGIPLSKPAQEEQCAISIYYPGHARFVAYDAILAFWNAEGNRYLYGYQLKEECKTPSGWAFEEIFSQSYLIRGASSDRISNVRRWLAVKDDDLDVFFGESAIHWSAKNWKKLQEGATNNGLAS